MKITLAILMTLLIVVTLIFPADAAENNDLTSMDLNPIDTEIINVLNDLTARSTVTRYFSERLAFLKGETTEFSTAIPAVQDDEITHRGLIAEKGITLISSDVTFESVHCEDLRAIMLVKENLTYSCSTGNYVEVIEHNIKVAYNQEGKLSVTFDAYRVIATDFTSSSFVVKHEGAIPLVAGGSGLCIVNTAKAEVGTVETGENETKYGSWYGLNGEPWCAIFVRWCAYHSNVSEAVIPREAYVPTLFSKFSATQKYYRGEPTPKPGDLYFEGTSDTNLSHMGIIVEVFSTYFSVVDGNGGANADRVTKFDVSFNATDFYAFVRPNYATSTHTTGGWLYDSSEHWRVCESCNFRVNKASHTLGSWQIDTSDHWRKCSGCNATLNLGSHSYGGWSYSSTYHWKACTSCGYKINHVSHTLGGWVYNSNQHWKTCSVCGYKANTGSHTYTAGICSTCKYNPNISIDKIPNMERSLQ